MKIKSDQHCQITATAENMEDAFKLGVLKSRLKDAHLSYGVNHQLELIFPLYQLLDLLTTK